LLGKKGYVVVVVVICLDFGQADRRGPFVSAEEVWFTNILYVFVYKNELTSGKA